ncbi:unnamed protein product [Thlaspi arvense]|uniref:Serpin domain-containing protein n=1 Tax=Thlaspi arvense TaxID=13288 RepID=A0AAU9RQ44_THLAR|nr:unnamed protein product [Thlaspi arvense]
MDLREAMEKRNYGDLVLMHEVIASKARNSNFIFSPSSINAALTMKAASSGSNSDELNAVYSEIATTVFADGSASGGPKISAVNGVWVDQSLPVNHSLKDLFVNVFKATFARVDFRSKAEQVRTEVNKWASHHTNGLIEDLLPHGSVSSKTNEVFRLPYRQGYGDKNREFSMYFYLPDKKDGLYDLMKKMASTPGFVDKYIPRENVKVGNFRIPKFKISFAFSVSRDFSCLELDEADALYHKACVEIDEEGTKAAAASSCFVYLSYQERIEFVADHPFLFLIREDRTGTVLFAGQIFDPSKSS